MKRFILFVFVFSFAASPALVHATPCCPMMQIDMQGKHDMKDCSSQHCAKCYTQSVNFSASVTLPAQSFSQQVSVLHTAWIAIAPELNLPPPKSHV